MKQKIVTTAILILLIYMSWPTIAQSILWSSRIGSDLGDYGRSGTCDQNGNFYFAGVFEGQNCFFHSDTLVKRGVNEMFLVKYNPDGQELWVRQIGNDNSSWDESIRVFFDSASEHIFVTGKFSGKIQFGTFWLTSAGETDIFIAEYSLDGQCIWAKRVGGSGEDGYSSIAFDVNGNIYMCGTSSQSVSIGNFNIPKGGFLAKFDSEGNCMWAKNKFAWALTSFNSQIRPGGLKTYGTNILMAGCLGVDAVISVDTVVLSHVGYVSSLVCCFDSAGATKWIREGVSKVTESVSDLAVDGNGNIYHTGYFKDSINFSGHPFVTNAGAREMYLVSYDKNGQFRWAQQTNGNSNNQGYNLTTYKYGRVAVVGYLMGTVSFGPVQISTIGFQDMFLAGYDSLGNCLGVSNYANSYGTGICDDPAGNLYFTCLFNPSTTIGKQTYASYGLLDIVVAKCSAITGIGGPEPWEEERLLIYANPTTGKCTVTLPAALQHEPDLVLRVFDSGGRQVGEYPLDQSAGKIQLNVEALAQGIYQVVVSGGGKVVSGKVVFKR